MSCVTFARFTHFGHIEYRIGTGTWMVISQGELRRMERSMDPRERLDAGWIRQYLDGTKWPSEYSPVGQPK